MLEVTPAPPANATAATATVLCSKGGKECAKYAQVSVTFADLQDMQNYMRQTIDQGLADLRSKQGQDGLPVPPPSADAPPVQPPYVAAAPPPEQNLAAEITQQSKEADQAEQQVAREVRPPNPTDLLFPKPSSPSAPITVLEGQTVDEVTAELGTPRNVVDLGAKKIYVYPDLKIIFQAGKVSDVQ